MSAFMSGMVPRKSQTQQKTAMPPLTSLVDMMTILLVFLLQSFSAEGQLVTPSKDLELAESTSKKSPKPSLMIEVTQNSVMVDGRVIVSINEIDTTQGLDIKILHDELTDIASLSDKEEREVIIQCDKNTDFKHLKKIMGTCARASWSQFSLLVVEREN
ncbi:MAG: biopolymer transporter ExbD [Fibrobacteres bacterium]|nr:biopolymer transporter ExbD [Fibrobacterota bacterium]